MKIAMRMIDIVGALLFLLLAAPMLFLIAVLIKLDSRGPIVFSSMKLGSGSRVFRMYKFRTMRVDADPLPRSWLANRRDPRLTRVGSWLRWSSFDEMPQLFNILFGDMSFVGPRAETPYADFKPSAVKPGLTSLWWAASEREAAREHGAQAGRAIAPIARVFDLLAHVLPRRLSDEELGDAIEAMRLRLERDGSVGRAYVSMIKAIAWVLINAVREWARSMFARKRR